MAYSRELQRISQNYLFYDVRAREVVTGNEDFANGLTHGRDPGLWFKTGDRRDAEMGLGRAQAALAGGAADGRSDQKTRGRPVENLGD